MANKRICESGVHARLGNTTHENAYVECGGRDAALA
jgi:hypothetical protein